MNSSRRYYYLEIVEMQNITRAAENLMISQPSLTQYLNRLEGQLNIKLIDRNYTPLRLTQAGKLYFEYLSDARERENRLMDELALLRKRDTMPLRIAMPMQKSTKFTRSILPKFIEWSTSIDLSVWEGTSNTVYERITENKADIGFAHTLLHEDPLCDFECLTREKILIVCNRENPIVSGQQATMDYSALINPRLLNDQVFFQMGEDYLLYKVERQQLEQHHVRPKRQVQISNLHNIISAILENKTSGFAYIPDYVFSDAWIRAILPRLAFFRLDEEQLTWQFSMMRRKNHPLSKEGQLLWDIVIEARDNADA